MNSSYHEQFGPWEVRTKGSSDLGKFVPWVVWTFNTVLQLLVVDLFGRLCSVIEFEVSLNNATSLRGWVSGPPCGNEP